MKKTTIHSGVLYGFLLGASLSLGTQILTMVGLGLTYAYVIMTYALLSLFIILSQRQQWIEKNSSIPFIKALISVVIIVLISRYVFQLYMFMYTSFIDPDWVNNVATDWTSVLQNQGYSQEEINRQISSFKLSYKPSQMFTLEIIKYGISQMILGMFISIYFIVKKPSIQKA